VVLFIFALVIFFCFALIKRRLSRRTDIPRLTRRSMIVSTEQGDRRSSYNGTSGNGNASRSDARFIEFPRFSVDTRDTRYPDEPTNYCAIATTPAEPFPFDNHETPLEETGNIAYLVFEANDRSSPGRMNVGGSKSEVLNKAMRTSNDSSLPSQSFADSVSRNGSIFTGRSMKTFKTTGSTAGGSLLDYYAEEVTKKV
jgi:hypothetical protein